MNDVRRAAQGLGKKTISAAVYDSCGAYTSSTIQRRLGGWNTALKKAGLGIYKLGRISEHELMQNLKRVWSKLGRQPVVGDMKKPLTAYSVNSYAAKFGSWRRALEIFVKQNSKNYKLTGRKLARKKKLTKSGYVTKSLRYEILKRDSYRCRLCGSSPAITRGVTLHVDHIIPRSRGGDTSPANLQTLCSECNYGKGTKTITDSSDSSD